MKPSHIHNLYIREERARRRFAVAVAVNALLYFAFFTAVAALLYLTFAT